MKTIQFLILFIYIAVFNDVNAQSSASTAAIGKIEIVQPFTVQELLQKHIAANAQASLRGYRVKIHFGSDKSQAHEIKEEFIKIFNNTAAYVEYDQPYFNVTVGDYRTKLEAYKFLKQLQYKYEAAFLVESDIVLEIE